MAEENKTNFRMIRKILESQGYTNLSDFLAKGAGELDMSYTYGSKFRSIISQYLIYLPVKEYLKSKIVSEADRELIHSAILDVYPIQDEAPEVTSFEFRLLKEEDNETLINSETADVNFRENSKEFHEKSKKRIKDEDYSGAITAAGSFLEDVLDDIHIKVTGRTTGRTGDIRLDYRKVKNLLNLSEERYTNESLRSILSGLSSITSGLDALNNQMGDRHKRPYKPEKHHATLCVNSATLLADFLYETLDYQSKKINTLYAELYNLLDSDLRMLGRTDLLSNEQIIDHLAKYDEYLRLRIKEHIVNNFVIDKYRSSDIFFSMMNIFMDQLTREDIATIFSDTRLSNSQACGLTDYLIKAAEERPEIIPKDVSDYLEQVEAMANDFEIPF